eukprot:TRINITY_DN605_c0_g1_i1.p1 TRINITY_DN605_c0_g1~~TRINITY_DN605_c0_g1_i1.p1  ORF type:complete len:407 (-),score=9.67 TRINITY_DN605_c0_g1_i1:396-1616(-)
MSRQAIGWCYGKETCQDINTVQYHIIQGGFCLWAFVMAHIFVPFIAATTLPITCDYERWPEGVVDLIAFMPTQSFETCHQICEMAVECEYYQFVHNEGLCLLSETPLDFVLGSGEYLGQIDRASLDVQSSSNIAGTTSLASVSTSTSTSAMSSSFSGANCIGNDASSFAEADSVAFGSSASAQAKTYVSCTGGSIGDLSQNQPEYGKEYLGEDISESFRVNSASDCQHICDLVSGCNYYTFMTIKQGISLCWLMSTAYNVGEYYQGIEEYGELFQDEDSTSGESVNSDSQHNQMPVTEWLLNELTCKQPQYYLYVIHSANNYGTSTPTDQTQGISSNAKSNATAQATVSTSRSIGNNQCDPWSINCGYNGFGWRFVRDNPICYGDHFCLLLGYDRKWKCKRNCLYS